MNHPALSNKTGVVSQCKYNVFQLVKRVIQHNTYFVQTNAAYILSKLKSAGGIIPGEIFK